MNRNKDLDRCLGNVHEVVAHMEVLEPRLLLSGDTFPVIANQPLDENVAPDITNLSLTVSVIKRLDTVYQLFRASVVYCFQILNPLFGIVKLFCQMQSRFPGSFGWAGHNQIRMNFLAAQKLAHSRSISFSALIKGAIKICKA